MTITIDKDTIVKLLLMGVALCTLLKLMRSDVNKEDIDEINAKQKEIKERLDKPLDPCWKCGLILEMLGVFTTFILSIYVVSKFNAIFEILSDIIL